MQRPVVEVVLNIHLRDVDPASRRCLCASGAVRMMATALASMRRQLPGQACSGMRMHVPEICMQQKPSEGGTTPPALCHMRATG